MVVKDIRKESVTIEWKPPADDGGLELSKYSVEKCDVEKMVWLKVSISCPWCSAASNFSCRCV
jgi:hypothetical protein